MTYGVGLVSAGMSWFELARLECPCITILSRHFTLQPPTITLGREVYMAPGMGVM